MILHRKVDVCGAKKLWVKASMLSPQPVFERLHIKRTGGELEKVSHYVGNE
jgi:hypothetical protein